MDNLEFSNLTNVAHLLATRQISPVELTDLMLDRIDKYDGELNSYALVLADEARESAAAAEREMRHGIYRGPLHGIPVAVKDLCFTEGVTTAAGTTVMADFVPDYDATAVARLRDAGAIILGKLRMTEGAFADHHPDLPVPMNPWDPGTWIGSSSSGSAAATSAGLCFGSLGSDTGGSIRLPCSATGLTGLKPTWGRVSRYGVFELAASLDHVGPMARSAADCAAILQVIAGADHHDPTSLLAPVPDYLSAINGIPTAPTVGIDPRFSEKFDQATRDILDSVVRTVKSLGWTVVEVEIPDVSRVVAEWDAHCGIETALAHAATYPSRAGEYGPGLRHLLDLGLSQSGTDYQRILENRRAFTGQMRRLFKGIDLLLVPAIGVCSPTNAQLDRLGEDSALLEALIKPTAPFNVSGNPTITLPAGFTERGTPTAFQFVAAELDEQLLLQAGHAFQSVTDFHTLHPQL